MSTEKDTIATSNASTGNDAADAIAIVDERTLRDKIYVIRGQQVMLDYDLAAIYNYTTSAFNQQVTHNLPKFDGEDFMFVLTKDEIANLKSNSLISKLAPKGDYFVTTLAALRLQPWTKYVSFPKEFSTSILSSARWMSPASAKSGLRSDVDRALKGSNPRKALDGSSVLGYNGNR